MPFCFKPYNLLSLNVKEKTVIKSFAIVCVCVCFKQLNKKNIYFLIPFEREEKVDGRWSNSQKQQKDMINNIENKFGFFCLRKCTMERLKWDISGSHLKYSFAFRGNFCFLRFRLRCFIYDLLLSLLVCGLEIFLEL